jgi:HD superfamily phosphohydrolase
MDVDLERIAYTSLIDLRVGHSRRLCCDISGVHNLEQILFNKVLLYSSIYHHHKVRALACMFKSIFEVIHDNNLQINNLTFTHTTDFLSIDDYDIISKFEVAPELKRIIENLKNRRVLKRALVISRSTVEDPMQYQRLIKLAEDPDALRDLRTLIVDEISKKGGKCSIYDLWIDLPEPPSLREPSQCFVRLSEEEYTTLDKIFPADWWLTAYGERKWRGHIFCPPNAGLRKLANEASRKVLEEVLGIRFKPSGTNEAKIPSYRI